MNKFLVLIAFALLLVEARADNLTGILTNSGGQPIVGAFIEVQGGSTFSTSATGAFSITLGRGTYNLQIYENQLGLAPLILANVVVVGSTNLGTLVMGAGSTVSGSVKNSANVAIVNGDLDVFDVETGIKLDTPNDKTDALGNFSLTLPNRLLRVRAEPSVGLPLVAQSSTVNVLGPTSVGTIVLANGFQLSGQVLNSLTLLPLAGVDIDVDDFNSGQRIETPGDNTDATGNFSVIVPSGTFTLSFGAAPGQAFVGKRIEFVVVTGTTSYGTVMLDPGITISGVVKDNTGHPVAGADIDLRALAGDQVQYTPGDSTTATGTFSVIAKPGSYRVVVQADAQTNLVSTSTTHMIFNAATALPLFSLQPGSSLTGQITAFGGIPQADVRVIVRDSTTGQRIETPDNKTDLQGFYHVVVPNGNVDLDCRTRKASVAQDQVVSGIVVAGPTVKNVSLVLVPMLVYLDDPAYPGPQFVPVGAPQFFITVAIWNPTGVTSGVFLDVEWEDPFGNVTIMLSNSAVVLGAQQYLYQAFLGIPLPPVPAGNRGLVHKFRMRLKDPLTGTEVDADEFDIYPL